MLMRIVVAKKKTETLEHRDDLAEKSILALSRQVECPAMEIGHTLAGMSGPDENKVYFTQNWWIGNEHFVILAL